MIVMFSPAEQVVYKDEEIVIAAQNGDKTAIEYLLKKHKKTVSYVARHFFIKGSDRNDLFQEGMIALYSAIQSYEPNHNCSFTSYAGKIIRRTIVSEIKHANRQKRILGDKACSLENIINLHSSHTQTPEEYILGSESCAEIISFLKNELTKLEFMVFTNKRINNKSYKEISKTLGISTKCIDNAITRVKKKFVKYLGETKIKE